MIPSLYMVCNRMLHTVCSISLTARIQNRNDTGWISKNNIIFRTWTEEDKEFALQHQIADLVSSKAMRFD